tara:strand:+ start:3788 stop:4150 length:363 start_codon:yes stop_codon:yes gene_type:complete
MTRKFKNAVKDVVYDGIITDVEQKAIFSIAKKEGIEKDVAQIYLSAQLKKRKLKLEKLSYKRNKSTNNLNKIIESDLGQTAGKMALEYGAKKYLPKLIDFGRKSLPKLGKLAMKVITKGK